MTVSNVHRSYIIEVTGNVIAGEGPHFTQNLVAGACLEGDADLRAVPQYDDRNHSILNDITFSRKYRAVPYATYVSHQGIAVKPIQEGVYASFTCCSGFFPAFAYFYTNLGDIIDCLKTTTCGKCNHLFFNGMYVNTFSVLELFLTDMLLCGVFNKKDPFQKAIKFFIKGDSTNQFAIEKAIKDRVSKIVFHHFDTIRDYFQSILDVRMPDTNELKNQIYKRHNIVHRFAVSNLDYMSVCDASLEDLLYLIETVSGFVHEMEDSCCLHSGEREYLRKLELNNRGQ